MTLHIGVDEETGLTHSIEMTPASGRTSRWRGCFRTESEGLEIDRKIAIKRGRRKKLDKDGPDDAREMRKASARAGVEHPLRWLKRCFKCSRVCGTGDCTRAGSA